MNVLLALLFVANAIAHVISYRQLAARSASNAGGVLAFAVINAVLAVLMALDVSWAIWPALIFPAIGMIGLTMSTLRPGNGTPIDFTILGLDVTTIVLAIIEIVS